MMIDKDEDMKNNSYKLYSNINEKEIKLKIKGMSCVNCANSIEAFLITKPGVKKVEVNFTSGLASIFAAPHSLMDDAAVKAVNSLGFKAELISAGGSVSFAEASFDRARLITAAFFTIPVFTLNMFFHHLRYAPAVMSVLCLPVLLYSGFPFHKKAFITLKKRLPLTMDALISASSFSAFFLSVFLYYFKGSSAVYFDSSASIITIISAGKYIEKKYEPVRA